MESNASGDSLMADWSKAERHARAVSTGRPVVANGDQQVCDCCSNLIDRQRVNICGNKKGLSFLGFGVPLYFLFIKYCIVLNLLLIVTDGLVNVYGAYSANTAACNQFHSSNAVPINGYIKLRTGQNQSQKLAADQMKIMCSSNFVKIASVQKGGSTTEMLMRVSSFVIHLVFLIYIKIALFQTGQYYNEVSVDLADYSVIFKGLPKDVNGKRDIFSQMLNGLTNSAGQPLGYYDILVVPQKEQFQKLLSQKQNLKSGYLKLKGVNEPEAINAHHQYLATTQQINTERQKISQQMVEDRVCSQNVIVAFNTQTERIQFMQDDILDLFREKMVGQFGEEAKGVVIEQAPGPKQILWHNLKHSKASSVRLLLGWSLSLAFLAMALIVFFVINMLKAQLIVSAEFDLSSNASSASGLATKYLATGMGWATFVGIILFNKFVMGKVLHHFTDLEHHHDKADYAYSFGFKYALGMFFTTCMMTIVVQALVHQNYYSHPFGLIEQQSLMFIFSAVLVPLIWFINPYQLMHQHQRKKLQGSDTLTQKQANALMADYQYSVGKRYAEIIEMMWFMYLYADLIPGGMFVIILGLTAYYWVDKYNLLRRSSLSYNISAKLSERVSDLIDWTLFWRFLGEIIFDSQLRGQVHNYTFVLLGLSLAFTLLPIRRLMGMLGAQDFNPNDKPIKTVWESHFRYSNYRSTNPIFRQILGQGTPSKLHEIWDYRNRRV